MIGYNVKEISDLLELIKDSYKKIKDSMEDPWPALSGVMRAEWVGEDEYANEKTLSMALSDLYKSCAEAVQGVANDIHAVAQAWRQFQSKNTIEGGVTAAIGNIADVEAIKLQAGEVKLFKEGDRYKDSINLGLQNGLSSASKVTSAVDDYAKAVYSAVEGLYQNLDANKAFLGEDQAPKITEYLHKMGSSIAKLTVCIKSVKEAIGKAAEAYKAQAESNAESISSKNTDILGEYAGESLSGK